MTDRRIEKGMAAQRRLREARLAAGDSLAGWKVAFGTPEGMKRLGITAPLVGFLTRRAGLESGAELALADFTQPLVEPEIAVLMGDRLAPGAGPASIAAAIAGIGPALEIADLDSPPSDPEIVLAGDIYQRHWIIGPIDHGRAGARLDGLVARIHSDGKLTAETAEPDAATGDLIAIVGHVANSLARVGDRLEAGQIIICGSIVPPFFIGTATEISYALGDIGEISVRFR